jgi:hypothetical protein
MAFANESKLSSWAAIACSIEFAPLCRVNLNEEFNELLFEIVDDCIFDGDGIEISTLHSELMRIDIFKAVEFNCPFVVNPLPDGNFSIH